MRSRSDGDSEIAASSHVDAPQRAYETLGARDLVGQAIGWLTRRGFPLILASGSLNVVIVIADYLLGDALFGFADLLVYVAVVTWIHAAAAVALGPGAEGTASGLGWIPFFIGWMKFRLLEVVVLGVMIFLGALIGSFFLIVPGLFVLVAVSVAIPSMTLEKLHSIGAVRRSFNLVKNDWKFVLKIVLVVGLAFVGLTAVLIALTMLGPVPGTFASFMVGTAFAPFAGTLFTLLYFRLYSTH